MATTSANTTRLSTTEYAVLGMLSASECSGYELQQIARAGIGYVWTAAKSQVYSVLPRLVRDGHATSRLVRQERNPDKQVYRITAKGRRALREWLEEPVEDADSARSPFLLKVFLGGLMSRDALVGHIERRREQAEAELAEYLAIEREIAGVERNYYGYLTLRWGLAQCEAWIRWTDNVLEELRA